MPSAIVSLGKAAAAAITTPCLLLLITSYTCLSACASLGPHSLKADQVDYARALGEAKKREILAMIVGLRYADTPAFLNVTQIIASYTFDATGTATLNSLPNPGGPNALATGTLSYSNHPTFTFTPTTGQDYARAYIHPLAPALIFPLASTGIPIDLLMRITVQSIGGLRNATMLGGPTGNGMPEFFELLHILRRLQLAGEMAVQYMHGNSAEQVTLLMGSGQSPKSAAEEKDLARARALLKVAERSTGYELVYGQSATVPGGQIPVETRSILAILTDLGAEISVPSDDIQAGTTKSTLALIGGETRPVIIVHSGRKPPTDVYAEIGYRASHYWIEDDDFDSKYALTVVQSLMALAEVGDRSHAPIVTVPVN